MCIRTKQSPETYVKLGAGWLIEITGLCCWDKRYFFSPHSWSWDTYVDWGLNLQWPRGPGLITQAQQDVSNASVKAGYLLKDYSQERIFTAQDTGHTGLSLLAQQLTAHCLPLKDRDLSLGSRLTLLFLRLARPNVTAVALIWGEKSSRYMENVSICNPTVGLKLLAQVWAAATLGCLPQPWGEPTVFAFKIHGEKPELSELK